MEKKIIKIGSFPNDKTGDKLRDAFIKVNSNFDELQSDLGGLKLVKLYESEYQALDLADEIDDNTMYIRLPDPLISE